MSTDSVSWENVMSSSADQVQTLISNMLTPHKLSVLKARSLQSCIRHANFGQVDVIRLGYGAHVRIQPDDLVDYYLIQIPQYGQATVRCGGEEVDSMPGVASVLSPNAEIDMSWQASNEQIMIKIDRLLLEQTAQGLGVDTLANGVHFPAKFECHKSVSWQLMLRYLVDCARNSLTMQRSPLLIRQLEQLVVTTLLGEHPPVQQSGFNRVRSAILPRHIKQVENYLLEHIDQPINLDVLAAQAQVSVRTLQVAFKEHCGVSPMQYLRQLRLDRVRADLLTHGDSAECSVADIALRWGFAHLGRFSAAYRDRFGETPSQSLQRVRHSTL